MDTNNSRVAEADTNEGRTTWGGKSRPSDGQHVSSSRDDPGQQPRASDCPTAVPRCRSHGARLPCGAWHAGPVHEWGGGYGNPRATAHGTQGYCAVTSKERLQKAMKPTSGRKVRTQESVPGGPGGPELTGSTDRLSRRVPQRPRMCGLQLREMHSPRSPGQRWSCILPSSPQPSSIWKVTAALCPWRSMFAPPGPGETRSEKDPSPAEAGPRGGLRQHRYGAGQTSDC